jgi:hypothetical protein
VYSAHPSIHCEDKNRDGVERKSVSARPVFSMGEDAVYRYVQIVYFSKTMLSTDFMNINTERGGPGSSVGIPTAYGLEGPAVESRWGRDFPHLSRPALRPTQPPV